MGKIKSSKKLNLMLNIVLSLIFIFVVVAGMRSFNEEESLLVNSEYNGTIYAGDKQSKNVSLMINVYWGTEYLEQILKILETNQVKATFFVGGIWAKDNKEMLKEMYDLGHEIQSHGYSHKEHGKLGYEQNLEEIKNCHQIVKEVLNIEMNLFAPPGGSYSASTIQAATKLGYRTIMWTRDTIDWRDKNSSIIFTRAVTNLQGGDLILMHPTEATVEALPKIIHHIIGAGFNLVSVTETLALN